MSVAKMAAADVVTQGYATIPMPDDLKSNFKELVDRYARLAEGDKRDFEYPGLCDGFLPFGSEHAQNNPGHPDLCERFCYWRKNGNVHAKSALAASSFYKAVAYYESSMAKLGHEIFAETCRLIGSEARPPGLLDSYLQLCHYDSNKGDGHVGREFRMDPHVDGQLITFIAETEQGLLIEEDGQFRPIKIGGDQLFVMPGRLIEILSDGRIKGVNHGVATPSGVSRISLMYFMNPDFGGGKVRSLVENQEIDFLAIANEIHNSFGNPSYEVKGR